MKTLVIGLMVAFVAILTGYATSPQPTPSPQPLSTEATTDLKQPEPGTPIISGKFFGLPNETLVIIRVHSQTGDEILHGTRRGNEAWETVISNAKESGFYTVLADAEGFRSIPENYTIFIKDKVAYVVEEGVTTTEEARHLDFQFEHEE
jgi:hypothetical protein